jgi:hypothetical protein
MTSLANDIDGQMMLFGISKAVIIFVPIAATFPNMPAICARQRIWMWQSTSLHLQIDKGPSCFLKRFWGLLPIH